MNAHRRSGRGWSWLLPFVGVAAFVASSCSSGGAVPVTPEGLDLSPGILPAPVHWKVGPEGGQFRAGILDFAVPAGALTAMTEVTVTTVLPPAADLDADLDFVTPVFVFEPDGLQFNKPVAAQMRLFLPLDDSEEAGIYWSTPEGGMEELRAHTGSNNVVTFEVTHFSYGAANRQRRWEEDGFFCTKLVGCGAAEKPCLVKMPMWRYPEAGGHIMDKQGSRAPLTRGKKGSSKGRREEALAAWSATDEGRMFMPMKCIDRDEYPPAMSLEGGKGSSVRPIDSSDNRGAGSCMGSQLSGLPEGGRFSFIFEQAPPSGKYPEKGPARCVPGTSDGGADAANDIGGEPMDAGRTNQPDAADAGAAETTKDAASDSTPPLDDAGAPDGDPMDGASPPTREVMGKYQFTAQGTDLIFDSADAACRAHVLARDPSFTFQRSETASDDGSQIRCYWKEPNGTEGDQASAYRVVTCPEFSRADDHDMPLLCLCDSGYKAQGNTCVPVD
jgi:Deoxyribonuclease NucA/NucB